MGEPQSLGEYLLSRDGSRFAGLGDLHGTPEGERIRRQVERGVLADEIRKLERANKRMADTVHAILDTEGQRRLPWWARR